MIGIRIGQLSVGVKREIPIVKCSGGNLLSQRVRFVRSTFDWAVCSEPLARLRRARAGRLWVFNPNQESMDDLTPVQREQRVGTGVRSRMSPAEVRNIQIENVNSPTETLTESYHVRVPAYAQRIGKRLLFQPGYFQQGVPSRFSSSTRTQDIFFHHAWTEVDSVTIEMPPGFTLEAPELPQQVSTGTLWSYPMRTTTGKHFVQIESDQAAHTIQYSRSVSLGLDGILAFPVGEYSNVKRVFDTFYERDNYSVSAVQTGQGSGNPQ